MHIIRATPTVIRVITLILTTVIRVFTDLPSASGFMRGLMVLGTRITGTRSTAIAVCAFPALLTLVTLFIITEEPTPLSGV